MDRRDFLRTTGGFAAAAGSAALSSAAQASHSVEVRRTRTFGFPWSPSPAGFADDGRRLALRIRMLLDTDELEIRCGTAGEMEFAFSPVQSDASLHPAFAFFGGLPGGEVLAPRDLESWVLTGGGQALWDELAARHGFKPLLAGHTGSRPVLWSRKRLLNPEDLAGRRVIARGLDADVVRAFGALPVTGDETRLEAALASNDIDAVIWGSLVHASAAGIPSRFPFAMAGAFGSAGGALALRVRLDTWEQLTPAQQSAIEGAAASEFRASLSDAEATRPFVENALSQRWNVTTVRPSPEFTHAVSRIAAAVVAHAAAHDSLASRVDQSYATYRRAVVPASQIVA
jgi:TRAP-type mannitol/chloroaromatic compound transport system substrate-binding protein